LPLGLGRALETEHLEPFDSWSNMQVKTDNFHLTKKQPTRFIAKSEPTYQALVRAARKKVR
jgi:hypothetical protein